jgi:hypothetical protein
MSQALASTAARAARAQAAAVPAVPSRSGAKAGQRSAGRPSVRRPPLRVVQAPRTTGSPLGFAVMCAALLGAGLLALLLLNTAVAQDSFGLQRLQDNARVLTNQKQALIQSNDLAASPASLSAKAWALGLVPASGTAFVELPSGKVLGVANPAPRVSPPTVITSTNRTKGTSGGQVGSGSGSAAAGAAPGVAPAAPVSATASTGTAPPALAPAAPKTAAGQHTTTSSTPGTHTVAPPTTTR